MHDAETIARDRDERMLLAALRTIARGMPERRSRRVAHDAVRRANEGNGHTDGAEPGLVSPAYAGTAQRDLAAVQHAVAVLVEDLHLVRPCVCGVVGQVCEGCRIADALSVALGDAREFLEPVTPAGDET